MRINALLERKRGEWEEIPVQIHPDFPDTGLFLDKDRKVKAMDIACGLTWGGQYYAKSYKEMIDIVRRDHLRIEEIKQTQSRIEWLLKRSQATIDAAKDENNQDLIDYITKLLDSRED